MSVSAIRQIADADGFIRPPGMMDLVAKLGCSGYGVLYLELNLSWTRSGRQVDLRRLVKRLHLA